MKILILGGTGAMGSHLINLLNERGDTVVVTSRGFHKSNDLVEYRQGNAKDKKFLKSILEEQWDVIIDFMLYSAEEFCDIMDLMLSSTKHYIFLSSSRVYADSKKNITEDMSRLIDSSSDYEFVSSNEYSISKAQQENMLYSSSKKNWTIIRPYITYSEKRLQLGNLEKEEWLFRALQGKTIVFSRDINDCITTLTYGLDVALGIKHLIQKPIAYGEAYHITNECAVKWSEILEIYLDVLENNLGKRPKVIYQGLLDYLRWNPGKYQIIYDRLFNRRFNNNKIREFVNTDEFIKVNNGLKECLIKFLEQPEFHTINWKNEAIRDKFTKEKTSLSKINGLKNKIKYFIFRYIL